MTIEKEADIKSVENNTVKEQKPKSRKYIPKLRKPISRGSNAWMN